MITSRARCPNCKEEIDELVCKSVCYQRYWLSKESNEGNWSSVDEIGETIAYICPTCWNQVCKTEADAKKILTKKVNQ